MKIFPREVNEILQTLPIGYYAKERIEATLDEKDEHTYANLNERKIVVSFPMIERAFAEIEEVRDEDKEKLIRSLLYHEVAHCMITPCYDNYKYSKVVNIVEDERIETALANKFHNVDFVWTKKLINRWEELKDKPIQNGLDAFYRIVRFHCGKTEFVEESEAIVKNYTYRSFSLPYEWKVYTCQIEELYKKVCDEYGYPSEELELQLVSGKGKSENSIFLPDLVGKDTGTSDNENSQAIEKSSDYCDNSEKARIELSEEALKAIERNFHVSLDNLAAGYVDNSLTTTFFNIVNSFNRKNSGGAALQAYSGVLNPRLMNREDYRIFERAAATRGTNTFGTIHLNLFLDVSGSYALNRRETNQILNSLYEIEKRNKNFSFDVVYCGEGEQLAENRKNRFILRCTGGNLLDKKVFELMRRLQKPRTYNYTIVLFDGYANSDSDDCSEDDKNFGAFNVSNCTIISDRDNKWAIEAYAPNARKVFTDDYAQELKKNVTQALQFAFH